MRWRSVRPGTAAHLWEVADEVAIRSWCRAVVVLDTGADREPRHDPEAEACRNCLAIVQSRDSYAEGAA